MANKRMRQQTIESLFLNPSKRNKPEEENEQSNLENQAHQWQNPQIEKFN